MNTPTSQNIIPNPQINPQINSFPNSQNISDPEPQNNSSPTVFNPLLQSNYPEN